MCLNLLIFNPHRPDEHQVSMLQRPESAGEHVLLQPQIKTSHRIDALQHPTVSCQVRPYALSYVIVVHASNSSNDWWWEHSCAQSNCSHLVPSQNHIPQ